MKFIVTGCAGFIGMHVAKKILENGDEVLGFDNINSYYSVKLKKDRLSILKKFKKFNRFSAITRKDNLSSIRGLKRLKFKKEGVLRKYYFDLKTKKYYDAIILSHINSKN